MSDQPGKMSQQARAAKAAKLAKGEQTDRTIAMLEDGMVRLAHHVLDTEWERAARAAYRCAELWHMLAPADRKRLIEQDGYDGAPDSVGSEWSASAFVAWLVYRVTPKEVVKIDGRPPRWSYTECHACGHLRVTDIPVCPYCHPAVPGKRPPLRLYVSEDHVSRDVGVQNHATATVSPDDAENASDGLETRDSGISERRVKPDKNWPFVQESFA